MVRALPRSLRASRRDVWEPCIEIADEVMRECLHFAMHYAAKWGIRLLWLEEKLQAELNLT
ncbi:MAG: hypothetical protein JWQ42_1207 [Edaphobacter sp.]|nr:hypothetical protein [Edaphobacter sp.]